jgi:hypothetical protein
MTGEPFFLLLGAAVYALGWIYLPDTKFFRRWIDSRQEAATQAAAQAELAAFNQKRETLLASLTTSRRERYNALAQVCKDIEVASQDDAMGEANPGTDPRLRKLDELMWAYLRMLGLEENLERHLETERRDRVPEAVRDSEAELAQLTREFEELKKQGATVFAQDAKEKLINSRLERLQAVRDRWQKMQEVQDKLKLVCSEQERLEEQVKLIRADNLASQNTDGLSARIDASFAHLNETNRWLAEMEEFKDVVGQLPETPLRVGYAAGKTLPPVIPAKTKTAQKQSS